MTQGPLPRPCLPPGRRGWVSDVLGEVIDRIEHEGAREIVRAWAADRLRV